MLKLTHKCQTASIFINVGSLNGSWPYLFNICMLYTTFTDKTSKTYKNKNKKGNEKRLNLTFRNECILIYTLLAKNVEEWNNWSYYKIFST